MKQILLTILCLWGIAYGQTTGYLRYDSVKIEKGGGNGELILLNGTRGVTNGVLTNIGNGRTQFKIPATGVDSITVSGDSICYWKGGVSVCELLPSTGTWQQALTKSSTLTGNNTIAVGGFDFTWNSVDNFTINGNVGIGASTPLDFNVTGKNAGILQFGETSTSPDFDFFRIYLPNSATPDDQWEMKMNTDEGFNIHYLEGDISANNTLGNSFSFRNSILTVADSITISAIDQITLTNRSDFIVSKDSIRLYPYLGKLYIDTLNKVASTNSVKYNPATGEVTYSDRWTARVGSTTSSATPTINTDNVDIYKLTAQAADITSFTSNLSGTPVDGDILEIQITGTAARAITWGASFVSSTVTLPTTTVTTATLTVILQYYTTSSYGNNKWVCTNYY